MAFLKSMQLLHIPQFLMQCIGYFTLGFMANIIGMQVAQEIASSSYGQSRPCALQTEQKSLSNPPIFS